MHGEISNGGVHTLQEFDQAEKDREAQEDAEEGYDSMLKGDTRDELDEAKEQLKLDVMLCAEEEKLLKDKKQEVKTESDKMFEASKEAAALLSEGALVQSTVKTYKQ